MSSRSEVGEPVYLDHAASSPMRQVAIDAFLSETAAANASGSHRAARRARTVVDDARESLGEILGVNPGDVVFTSGGTESDNLAVLGRTSAVPGRLICSSIEHPAVMEAGEIIGAEHVGTDRRGVVDVDELIDRLAGDPVSLVSVMAVNNEVGAIQPLAELAERIREVSPDTAIHTDAVQALSWIDLRTVVPHVDMASLSAHKFGGPQGVGLCFIRSGTAVSERNIGGGQERERRSGTHNVAGIVAMAAAAQEADAQRGSEVARLGGLRDRLVASVLAAVPDAFQSGVIDEKTDHLAAGFAHFCFDGIESEALLFLLDDAGIYASAASACASGAQHRSYVLESMGVSSSLAEGTLRLTLGHTTTSADIERAAAAVIAGVGRLRSFPS